MEEVPVKHLMTGECFIGDSPTLVSTVLGSCLAVTMYSPLRNIGAVCHAFLPTLPDHVSPRMLQYEACKFVDASIEFMIEQMHKLRCPPQTLEVKVFGGANGISNAKLRESAQISVGEKNILTAHVILEEFGLNIIAEDVGGFRGRKLLFLTHTGGVWIKRLNSQLT